MSNFELRTRGTTVTTKTKILADVATEQARQIRAARPHASPWADDISLGLDDGAGYNFSKGTVRKFTAEIYKALRQDAPYLALKIPVAMSTDAFLGGDLVDHRRWIAKDVAGQLGVL